jgi:farnesyl diphosphate synthase
MDDDVLRRGRPTCHIAFGQATAILAGDALLTLAFDVLAAADLVDPAVRIRMVQVLACAAGWRGMVGGQALDVGSTGRALDSATLERMHRGKTGALVAVAVQIGALAAGATESQYQALSRFGEHVGLAFQMIDDVLDATATSDDLGKSVGVDAKAHKTTFASLLGVQSTRDHAERLLADAFTELDRAGIGGSLKALAEYVVRRSH